MWRRPPDTRDTGPRPARRAEVALLFLVQEAARTLDFGWRVEQRWPYYFFCRMADAEERRQDKTKI